MDISELRIGRIHCGYNHARDFVVRLAFHLIIGKHVAEIRFLFQRYFRKARSIMASADPNQTDVFFTHCNGVAYYSGLKFSRILSGPMFRITPDFYEKRRCLQPRTVMGCLEAHVELRDRTPVADKTQTVGHH